MLQVWINVVSLEYAELDRLVAERKTRVAASASVR